MKHCVDLGGIPVGIEYPPVFLAEIGALFNRDTSLAKRLIGEVADAARLDLPLPLILKGEILHDASICLNDDDVETFQSKSGERRQERYRDLIERKTLSLDKYSELIGFAHECGLKVVMSVYDFVGADFAKSMGIAGIKISSSNVTHIPLIRHVAGLGLPILIDNGRTRISELDRAVEAAVDGGCSDIILQHSPDGHPAPPQNHNLRSLQTLAQAYPYPVGLSDHFVDQTMLIAALALGANILEKNVVFDDQALEQDYAISIGIERLREVLHVLADCWVALGASWRDPTNKEGLIATSARMGLVTSRKVEKGEPISLDNISFAFPLKGIGAEHFDTVAGWWFASNLPAESVVRWEDVAK